MIDTPRAGERYVHWKNPDNVYEIVDIGISQMDGYDMKEMVIYRPLFKTNIEVSCWVRPLEDFVGNVSYTATSSGPRFIKQN